MPGDSRPAWQLDFSRFRGDASSRVSPQQALANAAMAEYTLDGSLHPLAAVWWLASGSLFGLAVVQLDPRGQYREFVTLTIDPQVQSWREEGTEIPTACAEDAAVPASVPGLGSNCGIYVETSGNDPVTYVIDDWMTPSDMAFAAARFDASAAPPAGGGGAASIILDGRPGWATKSGAYTSVVVPLCQGQSFVFAGTATPANVQQLAAIALAHLDELLPLR